MRMASCHPALKHHCKGLCEKCYHAASHKRRHENAEYRQKNRARAKKWALANPERVYLVDANKHLVKNFGITLAQYDVMLVAQNGVCKICRKPETNRIKKRINRLAVDHCHKTGQIRGLLCFKCNTSISFLDNNIELLPNVLTYLGVGK